MGASLLAMQAMAQGQTAALSHEPGAEDDMIIVTAGKPEGSVVGDIQPELTLTPGDIRSYGVSSIADLIAELSPQTTSGQGRGESPVVLLNGKRVSSFAEIRDIPTEAIQRAEVLPEEVALKYGYRPNQKVVNIVLRKRFRAFTGELEAAAPTAGGQVSPEIDTSYLRIGDFGRLNISAKYEHSSLLLESERDLIQQPSRRPYDLLGNITSTSSGEIDPALSALLGRPATVIGVPASAATTAPTLASFAAGTVNSSDIGQYRSLLPKTDAATLNAVLARTLFDNVSASFNGTLTWNQSSDRQGLPQAQIGLPAASPYSPFAGDTVLYRYLDGFGPLAQKSRDITGHLGMALNGSLKGWQWSLTSGYDHSVSRTFSDRGYDLTDFQARIDALDPLANPYGALAASDLTGQLRDRARSVSDIFTADLVMSGTMIDLPAGTVTSTFKMGGASADFASRSTTSGFFTSADLSRDTISGQASFDVPLTSAKNNVLAAIGDLSANFNVSYDRLSDLSALKAYGAGLTWTPIKPIRLIVSYNKDEGAPTVQQLGNPTVTTAGVRVFDYIQGETVDVSRISGGNPNLAADDRRVVKAGLMLKPFPKENITFTADYTNSRVRNPVASFPTGTAAIEAAFPDRFIRDADNRLIGIDTRPINFARQDQEDLRWGINFSKQLWTPPRPTPSAQQGGGGQGQDVNLRELLPSGQSAPSDAMRRNPNDAAGAGAAGSGGGSGPGGGGAGAGPGGGRGFGGPGGGPGGGRGTRLQLALYHTVHLNEELLVYQGGPVLDLLKGDAIGASGGQPRHEVQAQAGLTHNGFGARLSGNWQSGTDVTGGSSGTLRFSDLATLNLRLFANLGQQQALVSKMPFFRGSRVTLSVTNLFNSRLTVRDGTGATPVRYQPAYLDPLGRSIRISFRKLFFSPPAGGGPRR
jgi:iron complex outermembrane receptor protein